MIASMERLNEFLRKHHRKKSSSLWTLAHQKEEVVARINDHINSRRWHFSERTSKIIDGKLMTFYREWEDRFVEFCLYRYLMESAEQKGLVSDDYVSCKGKGRFFAIEKLFSALQNHRYVFKTDIKSYFASINTVLVEEIIHKTASPPPSLHYLIWQDLFNPASYNDRRFREKGIFQGSSLSSYYAWIYLKKLDDSFAPPLKNFLSTL